MADITPRKGSPTQFALFRILTALAILIGAITGSVDAPIWLRVVTGSIAGLLLLGWRRRIMAGILIPLLLANFWLSPQLPWSLLVLNASAGLLLVAVAEGEPFAAMSNRRAEWEVPPAWMWFAEILFFGAGWYCVYLVYQVGSSAVLFQHGLIYWVLLFSLVAIDARWIHPKFTAEPPVVFFDGVCGLCSSFVDWLFAEDANQIFRVSALQSQYANKNLDVEYRAVENEDPTSLILKDETGVYNKSTAVIKVAARLGGMMRWAVVFQVVPRFVRDGAYDFVAKNRYKWFGKKESCRLPTRSERKRFLM